MSNGHYTELIAIIEGQGSHFVSIEYVKRDGSYRRCTVQNNAARSHMVGDSAPADKRAAADTRRRRFPNLYNVWDIHKRGWRSVDLDTVISIVGNGVTLYFRQPTDIEGLLANGYNGRSA